MNIAEADWLREAATQQVLTLLEDTGHQAYAVGGCVRNTLLDKPVSDIDIATDAVPDAVMAIAERAGIKAVPTGLDHGTVTLVLDGHPFEVTTFRKDIETDGRHAQVAFTTDLQMDAMRRDFTINALYVDRFGAVHDPLGGLEDIQDRRLRFIGAPQDRIREDYLRILRFFRFHAWYADPDGGLDADGLSACADLADGLSHVSKERIGAEMMKLLAAPDPSKSLGAMHQSGVLSRVLPGSDPKAVFLLDLQEAEDPVLRLAALGGENPSDALRLKKADARRVETLKTAALETHSAAELGYRLGEKDGLAALALRCAFLETQLTSDARAHVLDGSRQLFPVTSVDLMPEYEGPALGSRLKELEQAWIGSNFSMSKTDLLAL